MTAADPHRARLIEGMAEAIIEKGYAAATIADVVRHARVSKRTFYEHFAAKEDAFLATYSALTDEMLQVIADAVAGDRPWRERVDAGVRAYLEALAERPALTRTFLMEIQAAGPRALALRRDVMRRFADGLRTITEQVAREEDGVRPLSDELATAVAGGINELMLRAVEQGREDELTGLQDAAADLIRAVVTRSEAPVPR
jgi:AcrR family transcriptional regulator